MWERQIFDRNLLKTVNICFQNTYFLHFSQKYKTFLWFSWKHMYLPCFQSKYSSQGLEKGLKLSTVCQKNGIFQVPKWFIFIFPGKKRLLQGCSELIFVFSLQNLYLHNNFNQNMVHKSGLTTQKNKVKVPCLSPVNQLLPVPYSHASLKRNSVFSLPSVSNCSKIIINKFFINTNQ